MANEQNLRPSEYKLSQEEAKKGGIKSGETRRQRKSMQELAMYILNMSVNTGTVHEIEEINSIAETKRKNLTVEQVILLRQAERALQGNLKSAEFIRDTAGQKPIEKVENTINAPTLIKGGEDIAE